MSVNTLYVMSRHFGPVTCSSTSQSMRVSQSSRTHSTDAQQLLRHKEELQLLHLVDSHAFAFLLLQVPAMLTLCMRQSLPLPMTFCLCKECPRANMSVTI